MTKAAIYSRVSTADQDLENQLIVIGRKEVDNDLRYRNP